MGRTLSQLNLGGGPRLHYAEQGNPKGKPVVFLHGFPDSWNSFRPVLDHFDQKYHAFSPDLRGFGGSDKPDMGYARADFAGDIVSFLDVKYLKKAVIVGHSMGSFIAQTFAILFPERTDKLVLIGSAASTRDNPVIREILPVINNLTDPIDRNFLIDFQTSTYHGKLPDGFFASVIEESLKAPAFVWKEAIKTLTEEDHQSELGKIVKPTFIAWGGHDAIFPLTEQHKLKKAIPGSLLKVYMNAGHSLNWDHAEEFTKDLENFIEEK
jgi:pimeloyl-ACP methyl ester carboxylesterase